MEIAFNVEAIRLQQTTYGGNRRRLLSGYGWLGPDLPEPFPVGDSATVESLNLSGPSFVVFKKAGLERLM